MNNNDSVENDSDRQSQNYKQVDLQYSLNRLANDRSLLHEIVQIFFEDSPELMQELATAVKASNAKNVRQTAHTLKGLVSNFGESESLGLVRQIEQAAREGDMNSVQRYFDQFKIKYRQLHEELTDVVS